jgi:hypothetical protein
MDRPSICLDWYRWSINCLKGMESYTRYRYQFIYKNPWMIWAISHQIIQGFFMIDSKDG